MTPTQPQGNNRKNRTSGNPATQARLNQHAAQQHKEDRKAEAAQHQRMLASRQRRKVAWWTGGTVAALAIVGVVIASFVFAPKPPPEATYDIGGTGAKIEGVETFDNGNQHVSERVEYPQTPPAGGNHLNAWLNCGVYTEPQENELAVHSQEHGAVWVTYDAKRVDAEALASIEAKLPSTYIVVSPFEGLDSPLVLSAWNAQLKLDSVADPRIEEFLEEYWRNQNVPEPTSACTGAIDGPGRR